MRAHRSKWHDNPLVPIVPERLAYAMEVAHEVDARVSLRWLAPRVEATAQTLSQVTQGVQKQVRRRVLEGLCRELGVPAEWLMGWVDALPLPGESVLLGDTLPPRILLQVYHFAWRVRRRVKTDAEAVEIWKTVLVLSDPRAWWRRLGIAAGLPDAVEASWRHTIGSWEAILSPWLFGESRMDADAAIRFLRQVIQVRDRPSGMG